MEQQPESSAGEMMVFGLIEQADRMGKSAQGTQRALTEQIQELAQLQEWTVNAAMELQKRADAAIKSLEAERVQWQGARVNLERNAVQAIHDAVRKQSGDIERQTVQAFAARRSGTLNRQRATCARTSRR
jgi:nitrogen-specific signal transduction histidine kinase